MNGRKIELIRDDSRSRYELVRTLLLAVLGIRDILVWIRILTNGSGSDSFLSDFKDANKLFFQFFLITYL